MHFWFPDCVLFYHCFCLLCSHTRVSVKFVRFQVRSGQSRAVTANAPHFYSSYHRNKEEKAAICTVYQIQSSKGDDLEGYAEHVFVALCMCTTSSHSLTAHVLPVACGKCVCCRWQVFTRRKCETVKVALDNKLCSTRKSDSINKSQTA